MGRTKRFCIVGERIIDRIITMKFRILIHLAILLSTNTLLLAQSNTYTHYDSLRGKLSPLRTCFDVIHYHLNLTINPANKSIAGYNQIRYRGVQKSNTIQIDLFRNWIVDSIIQNQKPLSYTRDSNAIFIQVNSLEEKRIDELKIYYHGQPKEAINPPWDGGAVWKKDSLGNHWSGMSCEGIGASLWWPCKDHLSDEPDSMRLTYHVPHPYMAIGNGHIVKSTLREGGLNTFEWQVSYPINNYNVTFNIAQYTHFHNTYFYKNGKKLDLDYYVLPYNKFKAVMHFKQVTNMLDHYNELFGPYPFPKDGYKMVETSYWGMEHQSAISYGSEYQNDVVDQWDYIIIHESAHEWWGNNVSCKDHAELWIHESFATYTEALLIEKSLGYAEAMEYLIINGQRIENKSPIIGPLDINYEHKDSDMYFKGALALNTLRHYINNDSLWFSLFPAIQKQFALKTIDSKTLITFIGEYLKEDLTWFFESYFYKKDLPLLYLKESKGRNKVTLHYAWKNQAQDFHLPIHVRIGEEFYEIIPSTQTQTVTLPMNKDEELEVLYFMNYINVTTNQ
jgi:aminopeptidase N